MGRHQDDSEIFQFFNEIGIIEQLTRAKLESVLPDDLKMSHFVILNHLVRLDGKWSPVRLAAALQVTKAAITNTLGRLQTRGLIIVEADPADGRGKLVSLTAAGKETRTQCLVRIQPFMEALGRDLGGDDQFARALPFLQRLRSYLDENR